MKNEFGEGQTATAIDWRKLPPDRARKGVVAIGNFDGVHRGHAALIGEAKELARTTGGPVTVLSFDPHPLQLLDPARFQPPLSTPEDRAASLPDVGADAVVMLKTDAELLNLEPADFFQRILIERFQARGLVEGFNFRFGRGRAGSVDLLREMCSNAKIPLRVVEPFKLDGMIVSSSKVRDALLAGDVRAAATLMNRPYRVRGRVIEGAKRGRTIGFPTANLGDVRTLLPSQGVYAVRAWVGANAWPAAANIGPNPTFGEDARKIEIHLIDYSGDLYGQVLAVDFIERLRETIKFNGVTELVEQMNRDVARARELMIHKPA
ncbi:MAG: bifunctional riboflavin kinase/FAD synthetase [Planctomycetes bacterium]|nr:bifunctional riboflavin kinase/FAD synthetase [Planctomycetota bacterium]